MPPLVSVIIPAYNCEATLIRAVQSVFSDSLQQTEIVIVDDGSTDSTLKTARSLSRRHPETVQVLHQPNSGANAARNRGLEESKGKYVQFLDADDELQNDKLAASIDVAKRAGSPDCIYTAGECIRRKNQRSLIEAHHSNIMAIIERRSTEFTFALQTALPIWRREFLLKNKLSWDESLQCWQEAEFYCRCLLSMENTHQIKPIGTQGIIFHRDESSEKGISSAYWSPSYITGQFLAIQKIVASCEAAGMLHIEAQHRSFLRRLIKRSIVGNAPSSYEYAAKTLRSKAKGWLDFACTRIPFTIARSAYVAYRKLKPRHLFRQPSKQNHDQVSY